MVMTHYLGVITTNPQNNNIMKKHGKQNVTLALALVLTALMTITSHTAKAEYVNAYVDGTVWECESNGTLYPPTPPSSIYYFTEGTTEIDNKEYLQHFNSLCEVNGVLEQTASLSYKHI